MSTLQLSKIEDQRGEPSRKKIMPPGETTGWHKHLIPVFSYVLEGTLTVEIEGHQPADYKKGTSFVESYDTYHKGTNKGDTDAVFLL